MILGSKLYQPFNAGYNISDYLNKQQQLTVIDYNFNSSQLEFYSDNNYIRINNIEQIKSLTVPYYLIISSNNWESIKDSFNKYTILKKYIYIKQEQFITALFRNFKGYNDNILVIKINK